MKNITLLFCALACMLVCSMSTMAQWHVTSAPCVTAVSCMATSGGFVYAGTSNNGMFRSSDKGVTWTAINNGLTSTAMQTLSVSGTKIYAGTWGGGAFVSGDNGNNWTAINNGLTGQYVSSFAINGSYILAATGGPQGGMYLSTDGGANWVPKDSGLNSTYMVSDFQSGTNVLAGSYFGGVFLSADSGIQWTPTAIGAGVIYSFAQVGQNIFGGTFANGGGIFRTNDLGINWVPVNNGLTNLNTRALAVKGTNILAGTDGGGVFLSVDNGASWKAFNTDSLTNGHIYSLTLDSTYIYAGTRDGHVWRRAVSDIVSCTPVVTASDNTICAGSAATLTASAGSAYSWNTGETTQSISVTASGVYSCAITTNCGVLTSNSVSVTVKPLPAATITANGPTTFCGNTGVILTASTGTSYLWNTTNLVKTTQSITVKNSQTVYVIVLGANGCQATSSPLVITSFPFPIISTQPKKDTVMANCQTAQFSIVDTFPNITYQWQQNVGFGFSNLLNAGYFSGVTTNTLTIVNAIASMNGYTYRCVVSNSNCDTASTAAALVVKTAKLVSKSYSLCQGDSIVIGNNVYSTTGTYLDTLKAIDGCDSIYLTTNLTINAIVNHAQSLAICAGTSYTIGSSTHDTSGVFVDTIPNGRGCDSIVTTTLLVKPAVKDSMSFHLCAGDSVVVGNNVYKATGIYRDTLTTLAGCDSIVIVNLKIDSIIKTSPNVQICYGGSYTVGSHTYTAAGSYVDTLSNGLGCDSIITTHLSVKAPIKFTQIDTLCAGNFIMVGNIMHDSTGIYVDTLSTLAGCDSIVTTHLVIDSTFHASQNITLCQGLSYSLNSHTYDTTGTYVDTIPNGRGCDSIVTTHLKITAPIKFTQKDTLCVGDSIVVGGIYVHNTTGTFIDTLTTLAGCDSIVTTQLLIDSVRFSQNITICKGNTYSIGIHTYDSTGTYIDTLAIPVGCDSIITTHLTVNPAIAVTHAINLCDGDSVVVGSSVYKTRGTYADNFTTGTGCDSIVNTLITMVSDFSVSNDTLKALVTPAIYQWFNCANRDSILSITRIYVPLESGNYAVIVTVNGCSDTSACVTLSNVGVKVLDRGVYTNVLYPNPASSQLNLHTSSDHADETVTVAVVNMLGQAALPVMRMKRAGQDIVIDISTLSQGLYFVQIISGQDRWTGRFVKE